MISTTREQLYQALFEKFSNVVEFKTKSRRWKSFDDVSPKDMPAIFFTQDREVPVQEKQFITKWQIRVVLHIYVSTGGSKTINPSTLVNPIIDAVESMLRPEQSKTMQTLGINGVSHCWISEDGIDIVEGTLGDIAAIVIPIDILAL